MIQVAYPWIFVLLPLPLLIYFIVPKAKSDKQAALKTPFFEQLKGKLSYGRSQVFHRASFLKYLLALIWILVIISGSGLQWLGKPIAMKQSGRDLMMAIDLSGSMAIKDMKKGNDMESRFDLVMRVANQFIEERKGDRVGLILFGTKAYLQTPLTFDTKTVQNMLNDATIAIAGPQTAIGDAIGLGVKKLMEYPSQSKALILLTDGENNAGVLHPIQAAEIAEQQKIKIYTIALGGGNMVVNTPYGSQMVNTSEDLDTKTLERIAKMTGGKYFRARDSEDLQQVYDDIDKLEPISSDKAVFRPITYFYPWTMGAALIISFGFALIWLYRRRGY